MPIYEYRCASCGFQREYLQKVADPLHKVCPECGQESFNKLLTAAGFQLKGSGWYVTDFKGSGAKPSRPNKDGEGKTGGESETKVDTKEPAAPACGAGACPSCS